ncbi:bestrophin family protein [Flavobacterium caeni]|uniref:Putative membrane protein n=1 Tax=Flavobacterium caeni TaxID=490189 RepID=A0A1G5D6K0_9FLAO|nr:bestrophin family ion channel [Flavobacterium caeni]SCY10363.1 putative membrane protein [Flavobacterium caeni]
MHAGKSYSFKELTLWTRHCIYRLSLIAIIPTVLYQACGMKWIAIPWTVVAFLGTATAFIVGFKNTQTYSRTWEARQIWGSILNSSRSWGVSARDFLNDRDLSKKMIYRHFAWLTALRYQMREPRTWESMTKGNYIEYAQFYDIPERLSALDEELKNYLDPQELQAILRTKNRAAQLLAKQSEDLKMLADSGKLDNYRFVEMQKVLRDLYDQQGRSERIKNFPYPRQFATINTIFVQLFCHLLPFGLLKDFDKLNETATGILQGHMVWFVIPFSVLISWVYTALDQIGESTENPFEGGPNDVPISQMSRTIEIDLREMLGETELPPALQPKNNIIL